MRVVRSAGQNVSPSDDGRLFAQIFSDGLFTDTTFTNLGGNSVQCGAMYGDLCGRDFTIEQMTLAVELPEGDSEETGYIYVEIDTSSDDVITLNSALAPFTPTYEDINTNGAVAQMILAEYTATAVAVTGVTAVYDKAAASSVKAGSIATVENAQATENHAAGDYILLNGQLYLVTAAVSIGETFIEGTNITETNVGDELTELKNGLTVEEIILPNSLGVTTFSYSAIYIPALKTVIISLSVGSASNISMSSAITLLPEGYRPTAKKTGGCLIKNDSNAIGSGSITVDTDGTVKQTATNGLRNLIGTIIYTID